jgi:hypothetical protein
MSRPAPLLFLLGCLLFFFAFGNHQLQGSTEARVAGIAMGVIKGLDTEAQLHEFLKASPSNVAVMSGDSEPAAPLKVLKIMMVGRQAYDFVGE